jgi:hypothetical protein
MIPYWWIVKHCTLSKITEENDILQFMSKLCHQYWTIAVVSLFSIEYDNSIWMFGTDHRFHRVIGSMQVNMAHEIEMDWVEQIPWLYRNVEMIYNRESAKDVVPHRSYNHAIDLKDREQPPWRPISMLLEKELSVLEEYLKEMLDSRINSPSKAPVGAPKLFVPKPHGRGLQLCVDYRGLNHMTIIT